jgi:hypothetical protein
MVTRSTAIDFIKAHKNLLGEKEQLPISSLSLSTPFANPLVVSAASRPISAFHEMVDNVREYGPLSCFFVFSSNLFFVFLFSHAHFCLPFLFSVRSSLRSFLNEI